MFFKYSIITIAISLSIAFAVALFFRYPFKQILRRITSDDNNQVWLRYINFVLFVASLSKGVTLSETNIRELQDGFYEWNYLWLSLYITFIDSLRGIFYALAYIFIVLATAFVLIRVAEIIKARRDKSQE